MLKEYLSLRRPKICPECKGQGFISCPSCAIKARPTDRDVVSTGDCPDCTGISIILCPTCEGARTLRSDKAIKTAA
jgi:DnaJ-class molecular chaperone